MTVVLIGGRALHLIMPRLHFRTKWAANHIVQTPFSTSLAERLA